MIISDKSDTKLVLKEAQADVFTVFWMTFATCAVLALFILKAGYIFAFAVVLFGVPFAVMFIVDRFSKQKVVVLDRQANSVVFKEQQLPSRVTAERPFTDLVGAIVQEHHAKRSDGSPGSITYRATLQFRSRIGKEELPLRDVFSDQDRATKLVDAINDWLAQDIDSAPAQA